MRVVEKKVFYCDHCNKHGLSSGAMRKHELHCTMNPERTCRWKMETDHPKLLKPLWVLVDAVKMENPTDELVAWLRTQVGGCPACMLAVFRQTGYNVSTYRWRYDDEIARFRAEERALHAQEDLW